MVRKPSSSPATVFDQPVGWVARPANVAIPAIPHSPGNPTLRPTWSGYARIDVRGRANPAYELQFIAVFVDSTREFLGMVVQLAERPMLLKFRWVDFISTPQAALREAVFTQLNQKLGRR